MSQLSAYFCCGTLGQLKGNYQHGVWHDKKHRPDKKEGTMKETENNDDNLERRQKFFQVDFVVSGFYLTF